MHKIERESPPIHHPPTLLHPALLAAAQHGGSPDYGHIRAPSGGMNMDNADRNSDCNSGDISYDGMQPTISFLCKDFSKNLNDYRVGIPWHVFCSSRNQSGLAVEKSLIGFHSDDGLQVKFSVRYLINRISKNPYMFSKIRLCLQRIPLKISVG